MALDSELHAVRHPDLHPTQMTRDVVGHPVGVLQIGLRHVVPPVKRVVIRHSNRAWHATTRPCSATSADHEVMKSARTNLCRTESLGLSSGARPHSSSAVCH